MEEREHTEAAGHPDRSGSTGPMAAQGEGVAPILTSATVVLIGEEEGGKGTDVRNASRVICLYILAHARRALVPTLYHTPFYLSMFLQSGLAVGSLTNTGFDISH